MNNQMSNLTTQEVLDFADMANIAYSSEEEIRKSYDNKYRIVVKSIQNVEGQCVLFFDDKRQVQYISNRGSSQLENYIKDGDYTKSFDDNTGIYMHRGFRDSALETFKCILPDLHKEYTTFITGHSLGGAIAVILHLYLLKSGFQIKQTVTFGQPKITNQDGVNNYSTIPLLRIVHKKDLVPLLPPLTLASNQHGSYCHLGEEILLLKSSYYCHLNEKSAEDPNTSDFWGNLVRGETNIDDHHLYNYISNLRFKLNGCNEVPFDQRKEYLD